jgi:hypothetical protein
MTLMRISPREKRVKGMIAKLPLSSDGGFRGSWRGD